MPASKKLILHIGFPKTGSSALQSFLSASVSQLEHTGVFYPDPEPQSYIEKGLCSGNAMQLLYALDYVDRARGRIKFEEDFNRLFDHMVDSTQNSAMPCTLFSGEVFSQFPAEHVALLAEKTRDFEVSVIAFVRDPFDYVCSSWKQRVKRSGECRSFRQDVEARSRKSSIEMLDGFRNFERHFKDFRLINYDQKKQDMIASFLEIGEIKLHREQSAKQKSNRIFNKSLSASQANLVTHINSELKGSPIGTLFVEYLLRQPSENQDSFYDRTVHTRLLEVYRDTLVHINTRLPGDQQLSIGYRNEADTPDQISALDIHHLLGFFQQTLRYKQRLSLIRKLLNLILRLRWRQLPLNFDPVNYALLNPDLPRHGINLYAHFIKQGRKEGRAYRLKGLEKECSERETGPTVLN